MRIIPVVLCTVASFSLFAQTPTVTPELKNLSLQERFQLMKSSSQTFQDYKVIKAIVLDKEWKITIDSVATNRAHWREAKGEIARLETELQNVQIALKQREDSMAGIEHDATHINFAGLDFNKTAFVGIVIMIVAAVLLVLGLVAGRLKLVQYDLREKVDSMTSISLEFEEYKRKALEKQSKLSRELQTERNRVQELRGAKV